VMLAPCQIAGSDSTMHRNRPTIVTPATTTESREDDDDERGPEKRDLADEEEHAHDDEHRDLDRRGRSRPRAISFGMTSDRRRAHRRCLRGVMPRAWSICSRPPH
jgi:hypothetical protein